MWLNEALLVLMVITLLLLIPQARQFRDKKLARLRRKYQRAMQLWGRETRRRGRTFRARRIAIIARYYHDQILSLSSLP